jgi:hypothetical protein
MRKDNTSPSCVGRTWRGFYTTFLLAMLCLFAIMASMSEGSLVFYDDFETAGEHAWEARNWLNLSEPFDDVIQENGSIRGWGDQGAMIYQNFTNATLGSDFSLAVNSSANGDYLDTVFIKIFKDVSLTDNIQLQFEYTPDLANSEAWWYEGGACGSDYGVSADYTLDMSAHAYVINFYAGNNTVYLFRDGTEAFSFSPSCNLTGYSIGLFMRTTKSFFYNVSFYGNEPIIPAFPLLVEILSPANHTVSNLKLNISYNTSLAADCSVYIDTVYNATHDGVNGSDFFYIANMSLDAEYEYYLNCTNGTTEGLPAIRHYHYHATAPSIYSEFPAHDNSSVYTNGSMFIIGNVTDVNLTSVNETITNSTSGVFYLRLSGDISNSTLYSLTNMTIPTVLWRNGLYSYHVDAADEVNYINETVYFTIDNTPAPTAGLITSPVSNATYWDNMTFSWTACISPLPLSYSLNLTASNFSTSLLNTTGGVFIFDTLTIADGNYSAEVRCYDNYSNYADYAAVPFIVNNNAVPVVTASSNINNVTAYPQSMGFTAYCLALRPYPVTMTTITNAIGIITTTGATNMSRSDAVFLSLPLNSIRVRCEYNSTIYDQKDYIVYMSATLTPTGTGGVSVDLTTLILVGFFVTMFVLSLVFELNIFAFIAGLGLVFIGLYTMPIFAFKLLFMSSGVLMVFVWALKGLSD